MKGSKTTTTCIDHLCSSTKKQAKNQKEIQSYNQMALSSLWDQEVRKTYGLWHGNRPVIDLQENQGL